MAIYHFSASAISRRSQNPGAPERSVVACAAYRSGSVLYDVRQQKTHDFTRKSDVVGSEIIVPEGTPEALRDRQTWWNTIEVIEKRKDACLAREIEVSLPRELTHPQRQAIVREFVQEALTCHGLVADVAYHNRPSKRDGHDNPHAHILYSTRTVTPDGLGKKNRELEAGRTQYLHQWRALWADILNKHLADSGSSERVDHRTLAEQGKDWKLPEPKVGVHAWGMEHRGMKSDRAARWRAVENQNRMLLNATPPDLADIIALKALESTREAQTALG